MAGITCLCGCGRIATRRGLYVACYNGMAKAVRTGQASWADLVSRGAVLPAAPVGMSLQRRGGMSFARGQR